MDLLLSVVTESSPEAVRVAARGQVDLESVSYLTEALLAAEATHAAAIVLDLSGVTLIDSTGFRHVLEAEARSRKNGKRLSIAPSPAVEQLIDLCGTREQLTLASADVPPR